MAVGFLHRRHQRLDGAHGDGRTGVQVSFDGYPAPLLYVQGQQINTVVPWQVAYDYNSRYLGGTQVSVQVGSLSTNTLLNPLTSAAPGIFVTGPGNQAAALNQDGTANSPSNPAAPGRGYDSCAIQMS
jgi:uncharacterized protein (TIGR03437 family)